MLDLDPGNRTDAARAQCSGDEALYQEVQWLLEAAEDDDSHDGIGAFLNTAAQQAVEAVRLEVPLPRGYRLLRRLDSGGMGVVYLAERVDRDLRQRVALKLLRLGLDHDDSCAGRFVSEGQILSGLSHPNIAHLLDAGLTAEGRPFLAMEYVEGERIDRWCDLHGLSLKERLDLFLTVCAAVDYAHRHLVIHRDIKPANILVTADGEPKLLDFGIARLLDDDSSVTRTMTGVQALTPAYASPEQIEGHGLSIATDVYSMGVVLYELVAGVRPFNDLTPAHRLSNAIVAGEIVPPSKRARRRHSDSPASAHEPAKPQNPFRRRLPADIDAIVLKAMRREPEHRYATVAELAGDLRSFLAARPIKARRGHWLYRAQRFTWRRRWAVAMGLTLLVLLIGFVLSREAQIERITKAREESEAEAAKAQQVADVLAGLFRNVAPRETRGAEITAQELLDRGVARVHRELTEQPELYAHMLHVLGRTYLELGLHDSAETLLNHALELRRSRLGARHPDVGRTLSDLGLLAIEQGEYAHAVDQLRVAVRIFENSAESHTRELAVVFDRLGTVYRNLGQYKIGIGVYEHALAIQRRTSVEDPEVTAAIHANMASLLFVMGHLQRAGSLYEAALSFYEQQPGKTHPHVGTILGNLARVRLEQGRLEGLEAMYRRSLSIQRDTYGAKHSRIAIALTNLGHFLVQSEQSDKAIEVLQQAVDVFGSALGERHGYIAYPLSSLGDAHQSAGRQEQARDFYRRSTAVLEKDLAGDRFHPVLVHNLVRLGTIDADRGNDVEAEEMMNRAVAIWRGAPKGVDPQLAPSLLELAHWLSLEQRCAEAVPLLERAARILRARGDPSSPQVAELRRVLGRCSEKGIDTVLIGAFD